MRSSPLYRAFRADKLNLSALQSTLIQYLDGDAESIPVIHMLRMTGDVIRRRCEEIASGVRGSEIATGIVAVESVIGGGTTPASTLPSHALALKHARLNASMLLDMLRRVDPPIIGRVEEERVLLDLRTVEPEFDPFLIGTLRQPVESWPGASREQH